MAHAMRKAQRSLSHFAPFAVEESVRSPLSGDENNEHASSASSTTASNKDGDDNTTTPNAAMFAEPSVEDEEPEKPSREKVEQKLKEMIENEFSLEILLKHRELAMIDDEINKCEAQMIALRNHYAIQPKEKLEMEPTDFTEKYANLLTKYDEARKAFLSIPGFDQAGAGGEFALDSESTYRTRSQTSSLRPSGAKLTHANECIYRRSDGVLVKLTCINCQRSNFSSAQGFLNHCRIAHGREFTSQDNAALICGEILPDEEQDKDGMETVVQLRAENLDPNKNLARPHIHFDNPQPPAPATAPPTLSSVSGSVTSVLPADSEEITLKRKGKQGQGTDSKIPRTADHLKMKFQNMLKGDEKFEELLTDVTTGVENPHLFEDEEEVTEADRQEGEKLRKTMEDAQNVLQEAKKLNLDVDEYLKSAMERRENPNAAETPGKPIKSRFSRGRRKSRGGVGIRRVIIVPPEETPDNNSSAGDGSKSSTPTPSASKKESVSSPSSEADCKAKDSAEHYNLRSTTKRSTRVSFSDTEKKR